MSLKDKVQKQIDADVRGKEAQHRALLRRERRTALKIERLQRHAGKKLLLIDQVRVWAKENNLSEFSLGSIPSIGHEPVLMLARDGAIFFRQAAGGYDYHTYRSNSLEFWRLLKRLPQHSIVAAVSRYSQRSGVSFG